MTGTREIEITTTQIAAIIVENLTKSSIFDAVEFGGSSECYVFALVIDASADHRI